MDPSRWFLGPGERGNAATRLDSRHPGALPWSEGNLVRPLVHGAGYFAELTRRLAAMRAGDLLLFVDWRGDPDERLVGTDGSEVARVLADAARRGVAVHGLVWRSHWDKFAFSAEENRHLEEDVNAAGGCCVLDMRVRTGGSHHQKFVVLRHPGRPDDDVAFVGGIDLCHSRRDDATHDGDPQPQTMASVYGDRPPWHDIQLMITGPAVGDVETVFRERWEDPQPLSRSPLRRVSDHIHGDRESCPALPPQLPDPAPTGPHPVQLLRTYPRRLGGYPFAPDGERSVARGYRKAIRQARRLVYIEDQYLWSPQVATLLAAALRREPGLRLLAVLPHFPDQDGRIALPPNVVGRERVIDQLSAAAPGRVGCYGIENAAGTPIYVHAKTCILDDEWAAVGSDNFNRRSWTHDSELSAAVAHPDYARDLRATLAREHLGLGEREPVPDVDDVFEAYAAAARRLQAWHDGGRRGPRPPGQLRPLTRLPMGRLTRAWAAPLYRLAFDPDGRPLQLRLRGGM
ncbi:MAG TPA: phospholipase D family protein [Intrasporangium sp.]|uniref:phospholipase D family protein n=1 Tax=Intrasporangium sp. TaxID=1925024 RepID=UPI002D770DB7|nr:phospholipase D family protein [Intrasporangium sp.]HET7397077.1 phospholipase D family protein [Intrasporangium sp.]